MPGEKIRQNVPVTPKPGRKSGPNGGEKVLARQILPNCGQICRTGAETRLDAQRLGQRPGDASPGAGRPSPRGRWCSDLEIPPGSQSRPGGEDVFLQQAETRRYRSGEIIHQAKAQKPGAGLQSRLVGGLGLTQTHERLGQVGIGFLRDQHFQTLGTLLGGGGG